MASPLSVRRRRRARGLARRIARRRRVERYGVYIHKQWGKDTRTSRTVNTEVVVAATTQLLFVDPDLVTRIDESLTLDCIESAFDQAGFPSMWLFRGLVELGAAEIRRLPRRQIVREYIENFIAPNVSTKPLYPRVFAVMQLTHVKYGRVRTRTYTYWVLFELTPEGCNPLEWNFGRGRPGRPVKGVVP